jgi:hypothetical protein
MGSLSKMLIAMVLLLPGGFLAAPLLWLAHRWRQRRANLLEAHAAPAWVSSAPVSAASIASPPGMTR